MRRRATIRTTHDDPELVARALCPDNTDEMETTVEADDVCRSSNDRTASDDEDGAVVTRIERETTGGLHSNVDDYAVNLEVAIDVARAARDEAAQDDQPADTGPVSETDTTRQHNE